MGRPRHDDPVDEPVPIAAPLAPAAQSAEAPAADGWDDAEWDAFEARLERLEAIQHQVVLTARAHEAARVKRKVVASTTGAAAAGFIPLLLQLVDALHLSPEVAATVTVAVAALGALVAGYLTPDRAPVLPSAADSVDAVPARRGAHRAAAGAAALTAAPGAPWAHRAAPAVRSRLTAGRAPQDGQPATRTFNSLSAFDSFFAAAWMRLLSVTKDWRRASLLMPALTLSRSVWYSTSPKSNSRRAFSSVFLASFAFAVWVLIGDHGVLELAQPHAQRLIGRRRRARVGRVGERLVGRAELLGQRHDAPLVALDDLAQPRVARLRGRRPHEAGDEADDHGQLPAGLQHVLSPLMVNGMKRRCPRRAVLNRGLAVSVRRRTAARAQGAAGTTTSGPSPSGRSSSSKTLARRRSTRSARWTKASTGSRKSMRSVR